MRAVTRFLCSASILATAVVRPDAAQAQRSFQGDGQVVFGTATINQATGTVVQVGSPQTVINWTPAGTGDFQPAGTTALFTTQSGSGLTDFAVLNRILPVGDNPVRINGTILSRLQGNSSQAAGTVYFYSPGGIVIGANAVIDVGSLGLTTSDPWSGSGPWLSADRTATFASSLPGRSVILEPGSLITTSGSTGSYTAIVAPQVLHQGIIRSSGGVALVAADAATITFSPDNLYSIQVSAPEVGSAGGLAIDGGRIGSAAIGPVASAQRLYLVSIPKNTAVTMLIQGGADLGFTPAGQASIDGDAIVLSAGRDIVHGELGRPSNGLSGNAIIQNATFRDRTIAGINGSANLLALTGDLSFLSNLDLQSGSVILRAESGHKLSVGGSLLADARQFGSAGNASAIGGSIDLVAGRADDAASGGSVTIGGGATLLADGVGGAGSGGTAGVIKLTSYAHGKIQVGGDLLASADGLGGAGVAGGVRDGGVGIGGAIRLSALGGVLTARNTSLRSDGIGGEGTAATGAGGNARSGSITVESVGGQLQLGETAALSADARGGAGSSGGAGGDAMIGGAGALQVLASQGGSIAAGTLRATASATGGTSPPGAGRSMSQGGNRFEISNGQANFGQLTFGVNAAANAPGATRDLIKLDNGTADVSGLFSFATSGSLGVANNRGRLTAGSIGLGAQTFVAEAAPGTLGSLNAGSWLVTTAGDFILAANLTSASGFAINAPGRVQLAGLSSSGGSLSIRSGGLLTIDGAWSAPTIDLTSSDINLGGASSLAAANDLRLTSINAAQMLIGDGLAGSGYALSNAEFARLHGGNIILQGRSDTTASPSMRIGRLAVSGAQLAGQGMLRFATESNNGRAGVIAISGAVGGTGFGGGQTVAFEAARVEVDASTGGINLTGGGVAPSGQLSFRTDRLWVASPAILAQLAGNAAYVGREADLAASLATPRTDGIIRAGSVNFTGARQILVQNSGTRTAPAGLASGDGTFLTFASSGAQGDPIELIVNGQIIQANGSATGGFAVQSALARARASSGVRFTANSSVNGCLVSAISCGPLNATRDEDIHIGFLPPLPDKLFGDDDDGDGRKKSGAITPAEKLVDRRPLERVQPIDEPVSGAGNPAMMGSGSPLGGGR
ncbi:hypothetical protein M8312_09850 [Sphingomonas sp. KRR8]|uniref:hypothetical protein n=1 Tax=Sphingomonas sp. KRR8 TaxID=2942996 RepID=UPI002021B48C|nr:hypothetical protein [Sphingomonas sp. KRR8]URD60097.1 hypothetical protein M8312_09850 [Sphingomonas sp. KRR8]